MSSGLLSPADLAEIRTAYPMMDLRPLTSQQEMLVMLVMRGYTPTAASAETGYNSKRGVEFLRTHKAQAIMHYLRQQQLHHISITKDMLNTMLLDAHSKSANTTEEVMAIKELGKLNDLYPAERKRIEQTMMKVDSEKQLKRLSEQQLMQITGDIIDLEPEAITYESQDAPAEVIADE